ncbi:MAG: pantoate--beta-alanine ligase [Acidobacteria bacterium]|nr:pantoate--beta-alanine ligase [Acidobacteriota bacterium]MCI0620981.1 pantoate--beta-alanine ligase [Acidobacteriota bacterium]MCI0719895.1 pantoate--beta-alanine ligase [Acidobacteriota bacterium]
MQIVRTIAEFKVLRSDWADQNLTVSLVPTMGALHAGHLSLLGPARMADRLVVSIFVNPTQFGPNEDLLHYPRPLEQDLSLLERNGVDAVFLPAASEIYPAGYRTLVAVDELSSRLCGVSRPSHFRGVATVVLKLFNIIQPQWAVFGQKDAQQTVILRRMVQDLNLDVEVIVQPIVREIDGLALSSRNQYLNVAERKAATILFRSLEFAQQALTQGESKTDVLVSGVRQLIGSEPLARLDYAEIVNAADLSPVEQVGDNALLALAVFIGKTRLIDNAFLGRNK